MKGVSEIIAIILILMIVVALAALAYTWFSGIFTSLTTTTSNATSSASNAMTTNFRIEVAKNVSTTCTVVNVSAIIRCLGTTPIDVSRMSAYVSDVPSTITNSTGGTILPTSLGYGNVTTLYIINSTPISCAVSGARLRLITATGLEQSITIS